MISSSNDPVWLAVYTKPRHEKVADEWLKKKDIESYLPLVKRHRQWKDRKKTVWMPLFRSYLFVHIPLVDSLYVLQTHGVHHIVNFNKKPAVIPDFQIEGVKKMLEGGYTPEPHDYMEVGEEVEITTGPMKGIQGILSRKDGGNRFVIKIDGIQQAISVLIDPGKLKAIKR
ncbi:MAG: UpxY family transcription antiterminator [Candidatus Marinimicrobia bacterium]|nr:UpxY family transcription antiterminator [Candidatus Neomarinimicrobiota bacterium]MBL7047139.1 UpxY family transcription antiterminator [Candidatus Neomarinimicrobiota bacterium]